MRTATEKEIRFINKHRAIAELQPEDVLIQTFLLANTSFIPKYSMFMHPKAVKQMADTAGLPDSDGVNFKVMHDRAKVMSLGKSFAGAYDGNDNASYAKFYFPKDHEENGYKAIDVIKGIETGVYKDTSWGLAWPVKSKSIKCSLCGGNPLWFRKYMSNDADGDWCGHWPGDKYKVTEAIADFIKKMKSEGLDSYPSETIKVDDEAECRMWLMDTEGNLDELSIVDRGASDSKPVREDSIPVKFSVAKEHPAFRLAASKEDDPEIKQLLGSNTFYIDSRVSEVDFDNKSEIKDLKEDKRLLGEQDQDTNGGDNKVAEKTFMEKLKLAAKVLKDGESSELADSASEVLVQVQGELEKMVTETADLRVKLADFETKYNAIPEDIRTQVEKTELTWAMVTDYIKTCRKELDSLCTDLVNAAVAAKGNDVKPEDLKSEIMTKAIALGLEAAIDHGRKMIKAYQDGQTLKGGQKTDPATDGDDDPAVVAARENKALKDKALEALSKRYN